MDHGYGHTAEQVAAVAAATASAELLGEYHEATYAQTVKLVSEVTDADLDRVVDTPVDAAGDARRCGWSPCSTTTCSTSGRPRSCAGACCGAGSTVYVPFGRLAGATVRPLIGSGPDRCR